ncbi:sugar ABC transporter ATP-binding protein [Lysobacter sp. M2-1]|uniref:sugar ABC transporter ATP-binding protein n=1 Tax=Lysobacter sp. M2-1 TaxID=2916839 RepID=UPI001F591AC5|nr:sugar ABC transporter ATP-binding protein [Lysobacter sp. M2-1]
MASGDADIVLQARGLCKSFAGIAALEDVDLILRAGEVHALMGQNGAGKSTLIKLLTGVMRPDSGEMWVGGQAVSPSSPAQAQHLGISTVYQEVNLCPNLSVAENIVGGRYPRRRWTGAIDWNAVNAHARDVLAGLHLDIDPKRPLSDFPVAVQQMVAIARALSVSAKLLILDEPTSSLDEREVQELFAVIRRLREQGMAILFVTHFLDQMYAVSDRVTVLRNGRRVGEYSATALPHGPLVAAMVGREIAVGGRDAVQPAAVGEGATVLEAHALERRGQIAPTDLSLRAGEVLGLGGLLGSGRTELVRLMFGLDRADAGTLRIRQRDVTLKSPADAIAQGLALCPEERKTEGIVADLSVRENIALALQAKLGLRRFLGRSEQEALARRYVQLLEIKTASIETPLALLSGGNQQKVVLARWLATEPAVLILDEPTRGIDVAAKQEIMGHILRLARKGMAVLFISAEMDELVRISDRIAVMRDRRKVGELTGGCGEAAVYDLIAGADA